MLRILIKDTPFPVPSFPPVGNDRITFCQHLLGDTFPPNITLFGEKYAKKNIMNVIYRLVLKSLRKKMLFRDHLETPKLPQYTVDGIRYIVI